MKNFMLYSLMLLLIPVCGFSQSKTTITIKSMTIDNGDTTVSERTYNSDDDNIILDDSVFGGNDRFIFFNKDYTLDTNFDERFDQIIHREMKDFFQNFNAMPFDIPESGNDFFSKPFDFNFDSVFTDENLHRLLPDTTRQYPKKDNFDRINPITRNNVTAENIIVPDRQPIDGYSVLPGVEAGSVKIVFQLDSKKSTQIRLKNYKKKTVYKEKIPSSKGIYTRIFDFSAYDAGTYYLELQQGKKFSASSITVPESNKNNFQFIF